VAAATVHLADHHGSGVNAAARGELHAVACLQSSLQGGHGLGNAQSCVDSLLRIGFEDIPNWFGRIDRLIRQTVYKNAILAISRGREMGKGLGYIDGS
jgi:hypothetical protein